MLTSSQGVGALLQQAIKTMEEQGAILVKVSFISKYNTLVKAESDLLKFEFKSGINHYLANAQSEMCSLGDIIRFNREHASVTMPEFGQDLFEAAAGMSNLDSPDYTMAKYQLSTMKLFLEELMKKDNLDAIAGIGYGAYGPPAISGWPTITLPAGFDNEVPVGITFFGPSYSEPKLFSIAYAFENATNHYKAPRFLPTQKENANGFF